MKKTNPENIEEAAKMGYSARLKISCGDKEDCEIQVVSIWKNSFGGYCVASNDGEELTVLDGLDFKITGFLPVGHLFGEPVIQEGQKFRVKETGEIGKVLKIIENLGGALYQLDFEPYPCFRIDQIEPVFE